MTKKIIFLVLAAFIIMVSAGPAFAQQAPAGERLGIFIGSQMISPGEPLISVWGTLGPPDRITGILQKNKKDIYVALSYFTYGITVHLHNGDNSVQAILVQENNPNVQLAGVPFSIGDDGKVVTQRLGKPDNEESGLIVYWKRGLYVNVDGSGRISSMMIALPGSTEYGPEEKEKLKQKPLIPS